MRATSRRDCSARRMPVLRSTASALGGVNMNASPTMVRFPGASGALLAGRLDLPAAAPSAFALFAHCFTCSKDTLAASRIGAALVERGFGVLRFDFTGLGGSAGDFANTNFSSNIADLIAAADWLRTNHAAPAI